MVGGYGGHWEMIVKLWKGKTEPALCLSWKECSRLGKPQVYGPGSDNSHDRVVKTAPKVRCQGWQKRFITEDSLSAKDAAFLGTPPGGYHRGPAPERGTYMQGVWLVQSPTARRSWGQSRVHSARPGTGLFLPHSAWKESPQHSDERLERPSPMAGTVYFGWYILKRKWTYRKWVARSRKTISPGMIKDLTLASNMKREGKGTMG